MNAMRDHLEPAEARSAPPDDVTRRTSAILYRRPGICVTNQWFIVAGRRFPVGELSNLCTARGARDPLAARAVAVAGMAAAGVAGMLKYTSNLHRGTLAFLALAAALLIPVIFAVVGHRTRPRSFELWGEYQGMVMLLFTSDDERQYGQVTRALLRAKEVARLGAVADPVASLYPWPRR